MDNYNSLLMETIRLEEVFNNTMLEYELLEEGYYFQKFKNFVLNIKDSVVDSMVSVFRKMKKMLFSLKNKGKEKNFGKKKYEVLSDPEWLFELYNYVIKMKAYKFAMGAEREVILMAKSGINRTHKSVKLMNEEFNNRKLRDILNKSTNVEEVRLDDDKSYNNYINRHIDILGKGISKIESLVINIERSIEKVNNSVEKMQKSLTSGFTRKFRAKKTSERDSLLLSALIVYADMTRGLMSLMKKGIDRSNRCINRYKNIIEENSSSSDSGE